MGLVCQDFDFSSDSQRVYVEGASSLQVRTVFGLDWLRSFELPVNTDIVGIENSGGGLLRIQSNHEWGIVTPQMAEKFGVRTGTVLLDLSSGRIVSHFPSAQGSAFSPDGRVLWTRDHQSQLWTTTLDSTDDSMERSWPGWLPDFQVQNWGTGSPWARVSSPLTNRPVVYFKALQLDRYGEVEWLAWTANNDYTGSAHWSKYVSLVWRNGPSTKKPDREAVRRALRYPAQLSGQATKPREYDLSVAETTGDTQAIAAHLDQVLENPGVWGQMCDKLSRVSTKEFSTRGYDRKWTTNYLSRENLERFRSQRLVSLRELSTRLHGVRTLESHALEIYLMVTLDLNGVEILPTLLELESILEPSARYHRNPEKIPDSLLFFDAYKMPYHTQVLAVITAILNKERVPEVEALGRMAPYDAKTRGFVVGIARDFLQSVKPEHYRGAQAMSTEPEVR